MKRLEKHVPDAEKQLSRVRSWDWVVGAPGMAGIVNGLTSAVTAIGTFIYAQSVKHSPVVAFVLALAALAAAFVVLHFLIRAGTWFWRFGQGGSDTAKPAPPTTGVTMEFGNGLGFDDIIPTGGEATRRQVSLALTNTGSTHITDVLVRFHSITPNPSGGFRSGALLKDGIDLPPGHRRFVPLACHDELHPSGYISQKISLCTPTTNAIGGGFGSLALTTEGFGSYDVVIEASAPGLPIIRERVILSVGDNRRLRLVKV